MGTKTKFGHLLNVIIALTLFINLGYAYTDEVLFENSSLILMGVFYLSIFLFLCRYRKSRFAIPKVLLFATSTMGFILTVTLMTTLAISLPAHLNQKLQLATTTLTLSLYSSILFSETPLNMRALKKQQFSAQSKYYRLFILQLAVHTVAVIGFMICALAIGTYIIINKTPGSWLLSLEYFVPTFSQEKYILPKYLWTMIPYIMMKKIWQS